MAKNAYEMRLDILKMAQEMLEEERQAKIKAAMTAPNEGEWIDRNAIASSVTAASYSTEDVINRASELYSFVNSNPIKVESKKK